jgi:predicted dienelactone hydrolase
MHRLLAILLLATGCPSEPDDRIDPLSWDIQEPGPYQTGYTTFDITYDPGGGEPERTIPLRVWYPTEATEGPPAVYEIGEDPDSFFFAPPADPVHEAGYPLHVFTHGHLGYAGSASYLPKRLASHGWVSVAPNHIGNTFATNINPRPMSTYLFRSLDVTQAINAMEDLGADEPLAGQIDTSRVFLSGHSFGTFTIFASSGGTFDMPLIEERCANNNIECTAAGIEAFRAGLGDPRVVASYPMAGNPSSDWFGDRGHAAVDLPVFLITGTADDVGAQGLFDRSEGMDLTWADVEGGCHQLFAAGSCDEVPGPEGFEIVSTYATAFARTHLLSDTGEQAEAILDGTEAVTPRVTEVLHR